MLTIVLGCGGLFCGFHDGYGELVMASRTATEQILGQGEWWYAEFLAANWHLWLGGTLSWLAGILLVILGVVQIVVRTRLVRFENVMLWGALALIAAGFSISVCRDLEVLY